MALVNEEVKSFIGVESEEELAYDVVEAGAVRRYAQAIMDSDPIFADTSEARGSKFGGAVAPPLFPTHSFRRPYITSDPLSEHADDPDFDGIVGSTAQGLPPLPLGDLALLNGGSEIEFYRYARHGERIKARHSYYDIYEKNGRSGPMVFVIIQTDYSNQTDELLVRVRKTIIRR